MGVRDEKQTPKLSTVYKTLKVDYFWFGVLYKV